MVGVGETRRYRKRKNWTRCETLGLIKCYAERKTEFLRVRKKNKGFENVLKDMIARNITDSSTSVGAVHHKMYKLLAAYRSAKMNNVRNRSTPYMDELEKLFGDKPPNGLADGIGDSEEDELLNASRSLQIYYVEKLHLRREEMQLKLAQRARFFQTMTKVFEDRFRQEDEQRKEEEEKRLSLIQLFLDARKIKQEHG